MSVVTYVFGILSALVVLVVIIELMRRGRLRERHAIWWGVGVFIALIVAIFPSTLTWAAKALGIAVPSNLVFFIAIVLLFFVSLQYGSELTRLEGRLRTLAEDTALLRHRIGELENRTDDESFRQDATDAADDGGAGASERS